MLIHMSHALTSIGGSERQQEADVRTDRVELVGVPTTCRSASVGVLQE